MSQKKLNKKRQVVLWLGFGFLVASNLLPAKSRAFVLGQDNEVAHAWQSIQGSGMDKIVHFAAFFAVTALFAWAYPYISKRKLSLFFLLGLTLEFTQLFVAGRSFEWLDLAANITGVALVIFWFKDKIHRKQDMVV